MTNIKYENLNSSQKAMVDSVLASLTVIAANGRQTGKTVMLDIINNKLQWLRKKEKSKDL